MDEQHASPGIRQPKGATDVLFSPAEEAKLQAVLAAGLTKGLKGAPGRHARG